MVTFDYVKCACDAISDKKGEKITVIDISEVSSLADFFVIANGDNINQVKAMCDEVEERLAKMGLKGGVVEGYNNANWVLMDYKDFIIHIFDYETRAMYDLERIWSDGKKIAI
ncbi:MAG: ribosome silencing factor [Lachnospiraceae bacterium]|nr:ribosome silencing factor [Lachnospiraceae bacterium]